MEQKSCQSEKGDVRRTKPEAARGFNRFSGIASPAWRTARCLNF